MSWSKYKYEIATHSNNNILDYMIDPAFRNIIRLFVPLFRNGDIYPTRNSFDRYYVLFLEIKDINVLIDNKHILDQTMKKRMKKLLKCQKILIMQQETY